MTKPVNYDELIWRVNALLRRAHIANEQKIVVGNVTLDSSSYTLILDGKRRELPKKEFELLFKLLSYDSLVYVTGKRYWYWNSRSRSINALDYLIQIRGYGLVDAVHTLVGGEIQQRPARRSTPEADRV